jgi:D-serine deaminase-like pyridoxal phosphate-dependent protein
MQLTDLETPALIIDRERMDANIARMHRHVHGLHCSLRPHVKTAKCIEVVRRVLEGEPGGITVSTLKEAEYFFGHGLRDIVYAVGLAPNKIGHVAALIERGAALTVLIDNVSIVAPLAAAARDRPIPVLIELDVDGQRSGVAPDSALLLEVARAVAAAPGLELRGVLTHAGGSYGCRSEAALVEFAELERSGAVRAADRIQAAGIPVPVVSIGSTPSALFSRNLHGVTEVRAGVHVFQDLVIAGIGVCSVDDVALSVLVSVIGHRADRNWIITDGGWMSLSRDLGTASQPLDQAYGLVRSSEGEAPADDLIVKSTNQEHGIIAERHGNTVDLGRYPVGTLLRVLPNHACSTAAQHSQYHVVAGRSPAVQTTWSRFSGW